MKRNPRRRKVTVWAIVAAFLFALALMWAFTTAVDKNTAQQNVMLCESAKKSQNLDWQDRCKMFYLTGDPEDIQAEVSP